MSLHADWKSASPGAHAPSVGLRQRKEHPPGRRRPSRRLEIGLPRRSSARRRPPPMQETHFRSAQAFTPIEIGLLRRLCARRRPPPTQRALFRSAQADRRPKAPRGRIHSTPKAFTPIEIGLPRRCAPGVGLRRRKRRTFGRRRPTVGRRPLEAEFIRRALRHASASADAKRPFRSAQALMPIEIGLLRHSRARRRPPPTQRALFRSAQADRRPEAS
jgi:hypothetical protein